MQMPDNGIVNNDDDDSNDGNDGNDSNKHRDTHSKITPKAPMNRKVPIVTKMMIMMVIIILWF